MGKLQEYIEASKEIKKTTSLIKDEDLRKHLQAAIDNCKDQYALSYLTHAIESWDQYGDEGLSVQLMYALNNMQSWQGEQARQTKEYFKKKIKEINKSLK